MNAHLRCLLSALVIVASLGSDNVVNVLTNKHGFALEQLALSDLHLLRSYLSPRIEQEHPALRKATIFHKSRFADKVVSSFWSNVHDKVANWDHDAAFQSLQMRFDSMLDSNDDTSRFEMLFSMFWIGIQKEAIFGLPDNGAASALERLQGIMMPLVSDSKRRQAVFMCAGLLGPGDGPGAQAASCSSVLTQDAKADLKKVKKSSVEEGAVYLQRQLRTPFTTGMALMWRGQLLIEDFLLQGRSPTPKDGPKRNSSKNGPIPRASEEAKAAKALRAGPCNDLETAVAEFGILEAASGAVACKRLAAFLEKRAELLHNTSEGPRRPVIAQPVPQYRLSSSVQVSGATWRSHAESGTPLVFEGLLDGDAEITAGERAQRSSATIDWLVSACGGSMADALGAHGTSPRGREAMLLEERTLATVLRKMRIRKPSQRLTRLSWARWQLASTCPRALETVLGFGDGGEDSSLWRVPPVADNALRLGAALAVNVPSNCTRLGCGAGASYRHRPVAMGTLALASSPAELDSDGSHFPASARDGAWQLWANEASSASSSLHVDALASHHVATLLSGEKDYVIFPTTDVPLLGLHSWPTDHGPDDGSRGDQSFSSNVLRPLDPAEADNWWPEDPLAVLATAALMIPLPSEGRRREGPGRPDTRETTHFSRKMSKRRTTSKNLDLDPIALMWAKERLRGTSPWRFVLRAGETIVIPAGCPHAFRTISSEGDLGGDSAQPAVILGRNFVDSTNHHRALFEASLSVARPLFKPPWAGLPHTMGREPRTASDASDSEAWTIVERLPAIQAMAARLPCCSSPTAVAESAIVGSSQCAWTTIWSSITQSTNASCLGDRDIAHSGAAASSTLERVPPFRSWKNLLKISTTKSGHTKSLDTKSLLASYLVEDCLAVDRVGADLVRARTTEDRTRSSEEPSDFGGTFFINAGAAPRHSLETLALSIFQAHTAGLPDVDVKSGGAEWWVQVSPTEKKKASSSSSSGGLVGFHFDRDLFVQRQARSGGVKYKGLHPYLSTVTYLTDSIQSGDSEKQAINPRRGETNEKTARAKAGTWRQRHQNCSRVAPTMVLDVSSSQMEQLATDDGDGSNLGDLPSERAIVERAWLSWPEIGKHIAFRGDLLHGAPLELGIVSGTGKTTGACDLGERIVVVVNVWLRAAPQAVHAFPATAVPLLHDVDVGVDPPCLGPGERVEVGTCKGSLADSKEVCDQMCNFGSGEEVHMLKSTSPSTRISLHSAGSSKYLDSSSEGETGRIQVTIPNWMLTEQNMSSASFELVFDKGAEIHVRLQ